MKNLVLFLLFLVSFSCIHTNGTFQKPSCDLNSQSREIASQQCTSLFKEAQNETAKPVIFEELNQKNKKSMQFKVKIASMLLPASMNEQFWNIVRKISLNNDSKLSLNSSQIKLNQSIDENNKILLTYTYDTLSNSFIISKIESLIYGDKKTISEKPFDFRTQKLNENIQLNLSKGDLIDKDQNDNLLVEIVDRIDYSTYEILLKESSKLNFFTSFELYEISNKTPEKRAISYSRIYYARKLKKYFFDDIVEKVFLSPIKTILISSISLYTVTHFNEIKPQYIQSEIIPKVISPTVKTTPTWVSPSIVKMAIRYPKKIQPEILNLMKVISNKTEISSEVKNAEVYLKQKQLKIDESDYLSIQKIKSSRKTVFVVSHQLDNGTVDYYAAEINPSDFPQLIKYFDHTEGN